MASTTSETQNITVRLDRRILGRAKLLAARRNTSISRMLADQITAMVGEDDAYAQGQRRAMAHLDEGLHLGGVIEATRDDWHQR